MGFFFKSEKKKDDIVVIFDIGSGSVGGASENDVVSKMQSHLHNDHADRAGDHKKMMHEAKKTLDEQPIAA
jgi:hypothetical protein